MIMPNRTDHRDQLIAELERRKFDAPVLIIYAAHPEYSRTALPVIAGLAPVRPVVAVIEELAAPPSLDSPLLEQRVVFTPLRFHLGKHQLWRLMVPVGLVVLKSWLQGGRFFAKALPADLEHRDLIAQQMEHSFWYYTLVHLMNAEKLHQIFRIAKPSAMVAVNDQFPAGSMATTLARRMNIPSIYVQESIFSDNDRAAYIHCQYAAAMDERHRQLLSRLGHIQVDNIRITGLPPRTLDDMQAGPKLSARQVFTRLGVSSKSAVFLFAAQTLGMSYLAEITRALVAALQELPPHAVLVIKTHPGHDPRIKDAFSTWLDPWPERVILVSDIDIPSLMSVTSCVVSCFSSTLLEAAAYGKPGIIFNLTGERHPLPFDQDGIALGAKSREELCVALRDVFENGQLTQQLAATRAAYIRDNPYIFDGESVRRACEFIEEIARQARSSSRREVRPCEGTGTRT
jgi:hypothetical protein